MATTLAQAKLNTQDDVDLNVIDEFRKESWLLDNLSFDQVVNPSGGGATLTYGYTRLVTERGAAFRAVNTEYTPSQATRQRYTVDLAPLGGKFEIDRVLAGLGPAASGEVALQMSQLIKATRAQFQYSFINGDGVSPFTDTNGFDGLDVALAGSSTELGAGDTSVQAGKDWAAVNSQATAFAAMEEIDELLATVEGGVTAILANKRAILRLKAIGRYAGYLSQTEDAFGRTVETFDGIPLIDLGKGAGPSAVDVIPVESRDLDGAGANPAITGLTDIYAVRLGLEAVHGIGVNGAPLIRTWLPDFSTEGAVKKGEVELGPVAMVLKRTKGAAVLRNVKVQ